MNNGRGLRRQLRRLNEKLADTTAKLQASEQRCADLEQEWDEAAEIMAANVCVRDAGYECPDSRCGSGMPSGGVFEPRHETCIEAWRDILESLGAKEARP